jgi:GNAT superfamily N-acetyltransferase
MLRDAVPEDHSELRRIFRRSSLSNEGDRPLLLAHPAHLVWRVPADGQPFRVRVAVTADGAIAGFATVVLASGAAELDDLFVDPAFMRRGIGLALVRDVAQLATEAGCSTLDVTANPHAAAFYAAAGFAGHEAVTTPLGAGTRLRLQLPDPERRSRVTDDSGCGSRS